MNTGVGVTVGEGIGVGLGPIVGGPPGVDVGLAEGDGVGLTVGVGAGLSDGFGVGVSVGLTTGVGAAVGRAVGVGEGAVVDGKRPGAAASGETTALPLHATKTTTAHTAAIDVMLKRPRISKKLARNERARECPSRFSLAGTPDYGRKSRSSRQHRLYNAAPSNRARSGARGTDQ